VKRIPPSLQMQQALTHDLQAEFAGHPLRQFVRRAAELLLQCGLEEPVTELLVDGGPGRFFVVKRKSSSEWRVIVLWCCIELVPESTSPTLCFLAPS